MVVVEVRQGTLWSAGRSWTRTTRRQGGRGGRGGRGGEEEDEEEKATDIKSNNPHLAGGEKMLCSGILIYQRVYYIYMIYKYINININKYIYIYILVCLEIPCPTQEV